MIDNERGTGRTTRQMQAAPLNATFVWCNSSLQYARALADRIGRNDLRIAAPTIFAEGGHRLRGLPKGGVVVDHAYDPYPRDIEGYEWARLTGLLA